MTIASPCINVCNLPRGENFCRGCYRSLAEIAEWPKASDARRRAILAEIFRRKTNSWRSS